MTTTDPELIEELEFKGVPIPHISYARRQLILNLVPSFGVRYLDVPSILFACICDEKTLLKSRRDMEAYDAAVLAWMEKVKYGPKDSEKAAEIVKFVLEGAEKNKAVPIIDGEIDDDLGNE
jgi:hypothetical protein